MDIDLDTALTMSGFITLICGVSFILNTALRRNDDAGRAWSVAFIGAILAAFANLLWGLVPSAWWAVAISNFATIVGVGSIWVGSRYFNRRASQYWIVLAYAGLSAIAVPLFGASDDGWSGGQVTLFGVALFALLGAIECLRGAMRRNINARVLAGVLAVVTVFYLLRLVLLSLFGPASPIFLEYAGTAPALFINTLLIVIGSISLSILQLERIGVTAVGDQTIGIFALSGALNHSAFVQQLTDWSERARARGDDLVAIAVDIDNLPDINTVMGRQFGDDVITTVGGYVRRCAPTSSLVGHPGAGRLVIIGVAGDPEDSIAVARTLQNVLVDEPLGSGDEPLRLTASFSIASTTITGLDPHALLNALDLGIAQARATGGNAIVMSGEFVG